MALQTVHGLPYPVPTDPVRDGADAMHALAVAVDKYAAAPFCRVTLANSALPGSGITGWGCTAEIADPSGTLTARADGITITKAGIYLVTMVPNMGGVGAGAGMSVRVGDPNTGAVLGYGFGSAAAPDSVTGICYTGGPGSVHPSFYGAANMACNGGYFYAVLIGQLFNANP